LALRVLLSVGLLGWVGWRTDWSQVVRTFAQLRLELWLAAIGLYVATQVVSSVRWRLFARPLGVARPVRQLVAFYFIGMYFNLILPTSVGGDVVRAWYLDGQSGRRLASFLSVLADRVSGLLVLLGLACVAVAVCPIALPPWVPWSVWGTAGGGLLALTGFALFDFRSSPAARIPAAARVLGKVERLKANSTSLFRPALLIQTTALSLVVQAANVLIVYLVGRAIGAPVPAAYYWIVVPMVTLLTLLPISLNGMGVREGGMVLFLAPLGIPEGTALSLAFLWFAVFTAASLAGGLVYLCGSFPRIDAKKGTVPLGGEGQSPFSEVRPDHGFVGSNSDQGRAGQPRAAA
jgi:uncharacterized membrane protein YbhN (UPF0104 family)